MKNGVFYLIALFATSQQMAAASDLSGAFSQGQAMGATGKAAAQSIITAGKGAEVVPNYANSATESSHFAGGQGSLFGPAMGKIANCASGPAAPTAYKQQECEAVNFLHGNPAKRVQSPISKSDSLIVNSKAITSNPQAYLGGSFSAQYTGCTTKTVTTPALSSIERCTDYLNVTTSQCSTSVQVSVSQNYTYNCLENGSSCQSLRNSSCTYQRWKLYDLSNTAVGEWDPLGNVTWQGQNGRWKQNFPTPPKYWGKIEWQGAPWYFDAYYNIIYDNGTSASQVARYRPGSAITDAGGNWQGAWFPDGTLIYAGVSGTWTTNPSTPPAYMGCANFNGVCYDTTSSGYVPSLGLTISVSGSTWSWTDPNLTCTTVPQTCTGYTTESWGGGYWGGGNVSCLGYIPAGYYGPTSWQCPYTYDCSTQSCTHMTYSGSFQTYPPVPPKFPGDIQWSGATLHWDLNGNIMDDAGNVLAHWSTAFQILEDLAGVPHGYFTVAPSNDRGTVVWDNVPGTWTLSLPTPPKWWGSFTVGAQTFNFTQPSSPGMLYDSNVTSPLQVGRFDQLPSCTDYNADGTCRTYVRVYNCTAQQSDPAATLVSSNSSTNVTEVTENCPPSSSSLCARIDRTCVEGPETRTIDGVPVYQACWRYADNYACNDNKMSNDCQALINAGCQETGQSCISHLDNGQCDVVDRVFNCTKTPAKTSEIADCGTQMYCLNGNCFDAGHAPDLDFAKVVAAGEAAREAGTYMDPNTLELFKGYDNRCTKKLGGLGNCCKTSGGGGAMSNSSVFSIGSQFVSNGVSYAAYKATPYVYDTLYAIEAPWASAKAAEMVGNYYEQYGQFDPTTGAFEAAFNPSLSLYGITWTTASSVPAATIGTNIPIGAGGSTLGGTLYFNPYIMAAQITLMVIQELMSCSQNEQMLGMKRGQNLCHSEPNWSYCSKRIPILRTCIETTETYCCYNSRLARIINEQGRQQLGKGWGGAESPDCSGFTAEQLQALDFSTMDLSEFYAEIMPKTPDPTAIGARNQQLIQQKVQSYYSR